MPMLTTFGRQPSTRWWVILQTDTQTHTRGWTQYLLTSLYFGPVWP